MAVYKGREVNILGRLDGAETSPTFRVLDQWGQEELVPLDKLEVTEDEKKQIVGDNEASLTFKVIKDKDLKDLRDGQDVDKIKAKQDKEPSDVTVPVSEIKVDKKSVK